MYSVLLVLSDPVAGREGDYNSWYSDVHIRDALRHSQGAIAAQRFRRHRGAVDAATAGRHRHGYLALYETSDPEEFTASHSVVFTPEMPISDAYSFEAIDEAYYDAIAWRSTRGSGGDPGGLVLERIHQRAGEGAADWYLRERFPQALGVAGVHSGLFARGAAHQLYRLAPEGMFVAVYRTGDLARTLDEWRELDRLGPTPWSAGDLTLDAFEPITPRLTRLAVLRPDPADEDRARRAREALGDRLHHGPPAAA
jgi:hypothetical protein